MASKWSLIRTLAQTYSLDILEALEERPLRFTDLADPGPNEATRSQRLKELEEAGLISTVSLKIDKRNFVHYRLTENGKRVLQKAREIAEVK